MSGTKGRSLAVLTAAIVAVIAIAIHGIDNTSSLNLIFPVVLDGIQALFGSSRKDKTMFEYAPDGLPLCMGCHCTPSWNQDPKNFTCPKETPPPWQYPSQTIQTLASQQVQNPYSLDCDPYQEESCDTVPSLEREKWNQDAVCGLLYDKPLKHEVESWKQNTTTICPLSNYTIQTFASEQEARD